MILNTKLTSDTYHSVVLFAISLLLLFLMQSSCFPSVPVDDFIHFSVNNKIKKNFEIEDSNLHYLTLTTIY